MEGIQHIEEQIRQYISDNNEKELIDAILCIASKDLPNVTFRRVEADSEPAAKRIASGFAIDDSCYVPGELFGKLQNVSTCLMLTLVNECHLFKNGIQLASIVCNDDLYEAEAKICSYMKSEDFSAARFECVYWGNVDVRMLSENNKRLATTVYCKLKMLE